MLAQRMRSLAAKGADDGATRSSSLLVMTYNVLAQCYIKSSFFPYCQPSVLRWKNRSKQLAAVFQALPVQPHVICLQEVDQYNEFWVEMMASIGYSGLYAQKTSGKRDGVAIFWKRAELELVAHETRSLDEPVGDESHCSDDLLARVQRGSVALIAHLQQKAPATPGALPQAFVVATTHLFWDPSQEDVKLLQTQRLLQPLLAFAEPLALPLVFAGDFNSMPQSRVYDLITRTHGFASAYARYSDAHGEPDFTNVNGSTPSPDGGAPVASFVGTLDYIFYRPSHATSMEPEALLELMALEEATKSVALPSPASPSDHLPLLCAFRV